MSALMESASLPAPDVLDFPADGATLAYEPAAWVHPAELDLRNAIFRNRPPMSVDLGGAALLIAPPRPYDRCESKAERAGLLWTSGDQEIACALDLTILERLLGGVQADLVDLPDPRTTGLLAEMALAGAIGRAEARISAPLACLASLGGEAACPPADAISFSCRYDDAQFDIAVWSRDRSPDRRAAFAEILARLLGPTVPAPASASVPVPLPVVFEAGRLRLSWGIVDGLEHGDVLIPDSFPLAGEEADVIVGKSLLARAKLNGADLSLLAAPRRRPPMEPTPVSQSDTKTKTEPSLESLSGVEVDLSFELGRSTIEVTELRSLAPGYVFPLGRDPKSAIDILANGRRIGRGEIVRVGDALGVRIVRLADKEG